jgi:hypothetical protein
MKTTKTTPSDPTGQSLTKGLERLDRIEYGENEITSYYTLNPEGHPDGDLYSWVEIPDHLWETAKMTSYINGIPMLFPNKVYKRIRD